MQNPLSLEEKALRILAGAAVFWSFFIASAIGVQSVSNLQAYVNEPILQAEAMERQTAALIDARRERRKIAEQQVLGARDSARVASTTLKEREGWGKGGSRTATTTDLKVRTHEFKPKHCPNPTATLKRGGQNMPAEVLALQEFLAERYAQRKEDLATGHFGPLTERLIAKFQAEQGLQPVGVVGPLTRAAIFRTCSTSGGGGTDGGNATSSVTVSVTNSTKTLVPNSTEVGDEEGRFVITFTATAVDSSVWINKSALLGTTTGAAGANYRILDAVGASAPGSVSAALTSTADTDGTRFKIAEGESETFTLTVEFDPTATGSYKMVLQSLNYATTNADPSKNLTQNYATDLLVI